MNAQRLFSRPPAFASYGAAGRPRRRPRPRKVLPHPACFHLPAPDTGPDPTSQPASTTSTRSLPTSLYLPESYRPTTTSSPTTHPGMPRIQWLNHALHRRILPLVSPSAFLFLPQYPTPPPTPP